MSVGTSLPERVKVIIPENGYESATELVVISSGRCAAQVDIERRRHAFFGDSDETQIGFNATPDAHGLSGDRSGVIEEHKDARLGPRRQVSIRDRIGCFTWTWFTMVLLFSEECDMPSLTVCRQWCVAIRFWAECDNILSLVGYWRYCQRPAF